MRKLKLLVTIICLCICVPAPVFASSVLDECKEGLTITVNGLVKGTTVNIHDSSSNAVLQSHTADSSSVIIQAQDNSYYLTIDWPLNYYRDYTKYPVKRENPKDDSCKARTFTINVNPAAIPAGVEYVPVVLSSKSNGELICETSYNIYYKDSNTLATDIANNELSDITTISGEVIILLSPDSEYEVEQFEIPDKYVASNERQSINFTENNIYTTNTEADVYKLAFSSTLKETENLNKKREEARIKIVEMYENFNKKKLSNNDLFEFEEAYASAMSELNTSSAPETVVNNYEKVIKEFSNKKQLFTLDSHIWHWVAVVITAVTLALSAKFSFTIKNIILCVINILVDAVIILMLDLCLTSLLSLTVAMIGHLALCVVKLLKQKGEAQEPELPDVPVPELPDEPTAINIYDTVDEQPKPKKTFKNRFKKQKNANVNLDVDYNDLPNDNHKKFFEEIDKDVNDFFNK